MIVCVDLSIEYVGLQHIKVRLISVKRDFFFIFGHTEKNRPKKHFHFSSVQQWVSESLVALVNLTQAAGKEFVAHFDIITVNINNNVTDPNSQRMDRRKARFMKKQ